MGFAPGSQTSLIRPCQTSIRGEKLEIDIISVPCLVVLEHQPASFSFMPGPHVASRMLMKEGRNHILLPVVIKLRYRIIVSASDSYSFGLEPVFPDKHARYPQDSVWRSLSFVPRDSMTSVRSSPSKASGLLLDASHATKHQAA